MTLSSLVQELVDLPERVLVEYVDARATEDVPPEALIILVAALRDTVADLNGLKKRVEHDIGSEHAPSKTTFQVPELGAVEVAHSNTRTQWNKAELLERMTAWIVEKPGVLCDVDTGEVHPPAVIARAVCGELKNAISFGAPKVPWLRAAGFDPDEWSESRWETHVRLPARAL